MTRERSLVLRRRWLADLGFASAVFASAVFASAMFAGTLGAQGVTPPSEGIWQFTYLKALSGKVEQLAKFIESNWFTMDKRARAAGHLEDYVLLRGTPADTTWDLLEITTYRDSLQHARIDSLFRVVYRPQHQVVMIDGRDLSGLGRIVASVSTRRIVGSR